MTHFDDLYTHEGLNHKRMFMWIVDNLGEHVRVMLAEYHALMGITLRESNAANVREFAHRYYLEEDYEEWCRHVLTPLHTPII